MKINIAEAVKNEGEIFHSEYNGSLQSVEFLGEKYEFTDGVAVQADYFCDGDGVVVMGTLEAEAQVKCSRCLKLFLYAVNLKFTETYMEQAQEGVYTYQGEMIDLSEMLEDNIVLNLPSRHLCSEDCKGLCAKCGTDLNIGECKCEDEIDETNPFYGLSKMTHDEEV